MKSKIYSAKVDTRDELLDPIMDVIAHIKEVKVRFVEQHAMSSHDMQSALILKVEFSKMYCTTQTVPTLPLEQ